MEITPNRKILIDIVTLEMTFGKYKGWKICDIPIYYLVWCNQKNAFPPGYIGELLKNTYEIKVNNMEPLLLEVKKFIHKK